MTATRLIRLLIIFGLSAACAGRVRNPPTPIFGDVAAGAFSTSGGYKGPFNNDDQGHADFCVKLTKPVVALRYADGTPSGFNLSPSLLQPQAGSGVWCPENGLARLDSREIVTAADGSGMFFHRGGWGFAGNDPSSAVHYGHIRASDIDTAGLRYFRSDSVSTLPATPRGQWQPAATKPWTGKGQQDGNGSACKVVASIPLKVRAQSIPADMNYLNSRQTGSIPYAIYGDPSEDLGPASDRTHGIRYTLLEWSWINVRGGGVARALVPDGANFFPCEDVPAITLASVSDAQTRARTGWVRAIYGAIRTGGGSLLYGWIVSAHRHAGDSVVLHLEAAGASPISDSNGPSETIALWPDRVVRAPSDTSADRPFMLLYLPPKNLSTGAAALVFAGGAYNHIAIGKEGLPAARWLNSIGVAAFIVRYRLGPLYHHPAMLEDAARAMRIARTRAREWGIDPARIGVVGFSAGGHLASTLATHSDGGNSASADFVERAGSRPAFVLLVYPVITMKEPFVNKGSRRDLLGVTPASSEIEQLSNELHVTGDTAPTFIVAATDDPGVPVENSLLFYNSVRAAAVPVELHLFQAGGHGFGLAPDNPVLSAWPGLAATWLRRNGWLGAH